MIHCTRSLAGSSDRAMAGFGSQVGGTQYWENSGLSDDVSLNHKRCWTRQNLAAMSTIKVIKT